MKKPDLSLVLPVHNQEDIIIPVVSEIVKDLNRHRINFEVLLVENGSSDNTYKVISKYASTNPKIIPLKAKKGYGSAIIKGLNKATGKYVSYMPSDGQLDPKLISKIYKLIKEDIYDMVKIKRTTRESKIRTLRSNVFNILTRILFKISITDINGSPRIFLKNWLPYLKLTYKDSFIDAEMAIKAYYLGWKIKEIPAKTLPRRGGKSTVNIKTVIEFVRNLINYRFNGKLSSWYQKNIEDSKFSLR